MTEVVDPGLADLGPYEFALRLLRYAYEHGPDSEQTEDTASMMVVRWLDRHRGDDDVLDLTLALAGLGATAIDYLS